MPIIEVPLPDKETLQQTLEYVLKKLSIEDTDVTDTDKILDAALGLTHTEAELAFSKAIIKTKKLNAQAIDFIIRERNKLSEKRRFWNTTHPPGI